MIDPQELVARMRRLRGAASADNGADDRLREAMGLGCPGLGGGAPRFGRPDGQPPAAEDEHVAHAPRPRDPQDIRLDRPRP